MGFLEAIAGRREPCVMSGVSSTPVGSPFGHWGRRVVGWAVVVAVVLAGVVVMPSPSGAQPRPTVVSDPGQVQFTVTGGSLQLGGVSVNLPPCDSVGAGCLAFAATIGADGRFTVAPANLQLPAVDLPVDQLGLGLPIGLRAEAFTAGPIRGLISPQGRLVTFTIGLGIRLKPDPAALGPLALFADQLTCGIGPVVLSLTSGGSGAVTGTAYDPSTGAATLVDGRYTVPGLACSPLMTTFLPLLSGGALGGVDIVGLLRTANTTLGLPSPSGDSAVVFDTVVSRIGGGTGPVPLTSGGALWPVSSFADVPRGAHFDGAVRWLTVHGITTGLGGSATRFGPDGAVTRGQMAAFLWRMMDRRNAVTPCGFNDVPASAFFDSAVCWLKVQAITTGVGGNTSVFAPSRPLTRGEMALFLWRLAGSPGGSPAPTFTDLVPGAAYVPAVAWLAANGITTGINGDPTRFAPGTVVKRAQMASFLYRMAMTPSAWGPSATMPTTMVPSDT
jgi:hypothetical protein